MGDEASHSQEIRLFHRQLHEYVKNPIHDLVREVELVQQQISKEEDRVRDCVSPVLTTLHDKLKRILRDLGLIDLSEIKDFDFRPCNIKELVREVCGEFELRLKEKANEVVVEMADSIPERLEAPRAAIYFTLSSLLEYSITATPPGGGVVIHVEHEKAKKGRDKLLFWFANSGEGTPQHRIENIDRKNEAWFRRWHDQSLSLRLSLVAELISNLGGTLSLRSEHGIGTRIAFSFELLPARVALSLIGRGKDALVVDDNSINRVVASRFLEKYGFRVECANDGADCLDLCKRKSYQLILMDIMMPNMSGIQAFEALQELVEDRAAHRQGVIVAHTAIADGDLRDYLLGLGFDAYIPKPLQRDILEEVLQKNLAE